MDNSSELVATIRKLGEAHEAFVSKYDSRLDLIEAAVARGMFPGGGFGGGTPQKVEAREHQAAFLSWARRGGDEQALRDLEVKASLSTLEDPDGGYLVPVEMGKEIERLATASVAMRRLATIKQARGEYKKPLSKGGATGGWVTEKGTRSETVTPDLTLFSPPWCEVYALPAVTQQLLDTSDFDVAAWLIEEINDVFVATEGTAFITGNGVGQPKGLLDYTNVANAGWTYGSIGYIASGHASLLNNADKLFDLQHALKPVYRQNASWLMNDATLAVVRKFKDGDGNYLWRPGLMDNSPDTLLGRPIEVDDNMPDIGANAYALAFGDFKRAYTIVDHVTGTRLLRDPYTNKPYVNFYTTKRVAGGVSNFEAVKLLKIAAS